MTGSRVATIRFCLVLALVSGCGKPTSLLPPEGRSDAECAAARDSLARGLDSGATVYPPQPVSIVMSPNPTPANLQGREVTIHLFVGASGAVDSVALPLTDGTFAREWRQSIRRWRFRPALYHSCPVPSAFDMRYTLPS